MAKRIFLFVCFAVISITLVQAGNLIFSPEKPIPGEMISIQYDLAQSPLKDEKTIEGVAYLLKMVETEGEIYSPNSIEAVELVLERKGSMLTTEIVTHEGVRGIFVHFENEDGSLVDNNHKAGYYSLMYTEDRTQVVAESYFVVALGFYMNSFPLGIDPDTGKGSQYLQQEFATYPASKTNPPMLIMAAALMDAVNDNSFKAEIVDIAQSIMENEFSETHLRTALMVFRMLEDTEKVEKIEKRLLKKYPEGKFAHMKAVRKVFESRTEGASKMEALYQAFVRDHADFLAQEKEDYNLPGYLVTAFASEKNWEKAIWYLSQLKERDPYLEIRVINEMVGDDLTTEVSAEDLAQAEALVKSLLEQSEKGLQNPSESKPDYQTPKQHVRSLQDSYGKLLDRYAFIHYKMGDYAAAVSHQAEALKLLNDPNSMPYERFVNYHQKAKSPAATEKMLAKLIQQGKANTSMKAIHKELYLANHTLETAYAQHLSWLEAEANQAYRKELESHLIALPAPDFVLKNLEEEEVRLSDLKGKIVVLDFWATWCGPCIKSFPSMQTAQEKLVGKYPVEFLFINAREGGEDKTKKVTEFIQKHNYPFQVLMDETDEVIKNYQVAGIPTKFVVGPQGNIRFRTMGFDGDADQAVAELETIIQLVLEKAEEATALSEE